MGAKHSVVIDQIITKGTVEEDVYRIHLHNRQFRGGNSVDPHLGHANLISNDDVLSSHDRSCGGKNRNNYTVAGSGGSLVLLGRTAAGHRRYLGIQVNQLL